jgi:hypothetical protein
MNDPQSSNILGVPAGAWIALNDPTQVDEAAQRLALDFNEVRENVMKTFTEGLRRELQSIFVAGTQRPRSIGSLIRHYSGNDDFLYEVINPIYKRATGGALPRGSSARRGHSLAAF